MLTKAGEYPIPNPPVVGSNKRQGHEDYASLWEDAVTGYFPELVPKPWEVAEEREAGPISKLVKFRYLGEGIGENLMGEYVPMRTRCATVGIECRTPDPVTHGYPDDDFKVWLDGEPSGGMPGGWCVYSGSNWAFYPAWAKDDFASPSGAARKEYS